MANAIVIVGRTAEGQIIIGKAYAEDWSDAQSITLEEEAVDDIKSIDEEVDELKVCDTDGNEISFNSWEANQLISLLKE